MMNEKIIARTALVDCLIDNNKFKFHTLNAKQIGAEDFRIWSEAMADLHKVAYCVYEAQENHADTKAPINALMSKVKEVFALIGDLTLTDKDGKEHKAPITIDEKFVDDMVAICAKYAGKMGSDKAPEYQLVESQIRNTNNMLKTYRSMNGINPEAIANLEKELENLYAKKDALNKTPDMCKDKPVVASTGAFRKSFEHHIARVISGQKAQSWEEYTEAKEARKAARKARHAEQKKNDKVAA